ncbi:E3 ubiquitin-protein ligase TRIM33 [Holothuria leucospilota]|uniref:E3 ubiquitin-protein ligase TRIM33 n=1 Tax=Holothuria leucospilota TaxID=206669 RepID=A0A9Q1BVD7_HOLLE|nr:E3 ubiquitin-protein ligase TRIM33 [Holothuria leucospilota]
MLPCLHSFCSGCLEKWKTTAGEQPLHCPTCRRHVQLPNTVIKGLPGNFLLTSLMERLDLVGKLSEGKSSNCEFCQNMTSVLFCVDCQLHVCVTCQVGHSRIPGASEHVVVASDKVSDVSYLKDLTAKKPPRCTDHLQEKLKFYCTTCSKLVCRDCTILSHQQYKRMEAEAKVVTELKFLPSGSFAADSSKFLGTISRNKSSFLLQQSSGIPHGQQVWFGTPQSGQSSFSQSAFRFN